MRVEADKKRCCGYGICAEICPEVFGLDDGGFVVLNMVEVPEELRESAAEACEACPEEAIFMVAEEAEQAA